MLKLPSAAPGHADPRNINFSDRIVAIWARKRWFLPNLTPLVAMSLLAACVPQGQRVATSAIYVVDGDTIKIENETYRLVGFDTPETYRSRCPEEKALGDQATNRLRDLLAAQTEVDLSVKPKRDKYGRGLARMFIAGRDVGSILINEGLARPYSGGKRQTWC